MTATSYRPRAPLVAIVAYTLRSCLPARRWMAALVPAAASVLFGAMATTIDDPSAEAFARVASVALFALVLPVTCLIVGDAVLGAEVRSGTLAFTWLSPVPTWQIAVGRWIGGTLVASLLSAAGFAAAALVARVPADAGAVALGGAAGAAAYVGVFITIGCMTRRAAVWSLAFVFLVERLLGRELDGIAQLSPSWLARAAYAGYAQAPEAIEREGVPHGASAVIRLAVITVVCLALASSRLRRVNLSGVAD